MRRREWLCLTHEARKALESTGNTNVGVDFDENPLSRMYIDLQASSLIEGRVEESQETLIDAGPYNVSW